MHALRETLVCVSTKLERLIMKGEGNASIAVCARLYLFLIWHTNPKWCTILCRRLQWSCAARTLTGTTGRGCHRISWRPVERLQLRCYGTRSVRACSGASGAASPTASPNQQNRAASRQKVGANARLFSPCKFAMQCKRNLHEALKL